MKERLIRKVYEDLEGVWPSGGWKSICLDNDEITDNINDSIPYTIMYRNGNFYQLMKYYEPDSFSVNMKEFNQCGIDLANSAPEGATHYLTETEHTLPCWIKVVKNGKCEYIVIHEEPHDFICDEWTTKYSEMVLNNGTLIGLTEVNNCDNKEAFHKEVKDLVNASKTLQSATPDEVSSFIEVLWQEGFRKHH